MAAVGVQVVRREAIAHPPERGAAVPEGVDVVDELAAALLAERPECLGRAARMDVRRIPFGGPADEVVPGASHRADAAGHRSWNSSM